MAVALSSWSGSIAGCVSLRSVSCAIRWHETANIHLCSDAADVIARDLAHRQGDWLLEAATAMGKTTIADWKAWKRGKQAR
jgi:hypothetical protein